ncbi:MAG: DUF2520 domain-containing protein [Bacteroidales bacterium]|nr:DUF2520 domain-containing protein [Bacteroidales bacterium]
MSACNISFIGAGNVAEALSLRFITAGHRVLSVASRGGSSAAALAASTGAEWRRDMSVADDCDILILAVTDTSVSEVASAITVPDHTIIVHTAGSVPLSALQRTSRAGVLYPLQTFTKGFIPDISKVPFFVEATDETTLEVLKSLGNQLGSGAYECDSERRRYLHVAAVFTNNFSNFMMTAGETIASGAGFDSEIMRPLIEETARKALRAGPSAAQTGPAVRHDSGTIKSHLELLSFSPEYQKLYRLISGMITRFYKKSGR